MVFVRNNIITKFTQPNRLVMDDNFSPRVKDVISFSKEEALRLGHDFIGTEHLMLGILRDGNGKAINILNNILFNYVSTKLYFCFLDVFLSKLLYSTVWYNILTKPRKI